MPRSVVEVENFIENPRLHQKCGFHVQVIYYASAIVVVFVDLFTIIFALVLFSYPQTHRESPMYRQLLQQYDRIHAHQYQLIYNRSILIWILLFFFHIVAIGFSILAVQIKKPWLMLPQLGVLLLRIGLLLVLFLALVVMNVISEEWVLFPNFFICFLLIVSVFFAASTALCFRYVLEKYNVVQKILASTKSVHFKEKKRRN